MLRLPSLLRRSFASAVSSSAGPIEKSIVEKLEGAFAPVAHLVIENESYKHSSGNRTAESHFKLLIVSEAFKGKTLVARHRMVTEAVAGGKGKDLPVHALSIQAKSPEEFAPERGDGIHKTPGCAGGH